MNISGIGSGAPIGRPGQTVSRASAVDSTGAAGAADRLELSSVEQFMEALRANGIRADKVASIKAQIEAGTYEDDAKVDTTVDRLLADLELG